MILSHSPIEEGTHKFNAGRFKVPVTISIKNNRYYFDFKYNADLLEKIKDLENRKYHGFDEKNPLKIWSAPITLRNNFKIRQMMGQNVFALYDKDLEEIQFVRPLFEKQKLMVSHGLTRKRCIIAGEMGTGKTLSAIEIMERSNVENWVWVGPKSAIAAVKVDMHKWGCRVRPLMLTYNAFTKLVSNGDMDIPDGIVFDECSKVKTPNSKRTLAALAAAEAVLKNDGYLILMSGTPAPKSRIDWWSQVEICCPGFLRESSVNAMKFQMAHIVQVQGIGDSAFPKLVAWRDDENRCTHCGMYENDLNHFCYLPEEDIKRKILEHRKAGKRSIDLEVTLKRVQDTQRAINTDMHQYEKSINEVDRLFKRLKGMVITVFKKDCVDLPDKFYRVIQCDVPKDMEQAANAVKQIESRGVTALMKLRQISDGFIYDEEKTGERTCQACEGKGTVSYWWSEDLFCVVNEGVEGAEYKENVICTSCGGSGKIDIMSPITREITSPKEEAFLELLDEYESAGRVVASAAFQASIDKLVELAKKAGWNWIRLDGRGAISDLGLGTLEEMLIEFQSGDTEKLVFITHPESGGMGLTLTKSPVIIVYSNDFKAENRMQLEDRIHRIGMDVNKGATIIDLFCLPTDKYILDNVTKKRDLQAITMGELKEVMARKVERQQ